MNRIEKNKTQTDQAWNKLHNRLETDGLLPTVTERRFATRPTVWIGIAAIAAIISLCVYLLRCYGPTAIFPAVNY